MEFLDIIFMIVAAIMVVLCLLQGGKSDGASGAIMGGGLHVFKDVKERGPEVIMSRITMFAGILFFALAILVNLYVK